MVYSKFTIKNVNGQQMALINIEDNKCNTLINTIFIYDKILTKEDNGTKKIYFEKSYIKFNNNYLTVHIEDLNVVNTSIFKFNTSEMIGLKYQINKEIGKQ